MRGRRSRSGKKTTTKSVRTAACSIELPVEFAAQAAGFHGKEVGQEASKAGPLPHTPIPAKREACGKNKNKKVSLSVD